MSILKLLNKYPDLNKTDLTDLNISCYKNSKEFINDKSVLNSCFAINFYNKTRHKIDFFAQNKETIDVLEDLINEKKISNKISSQILSDASIIYFCFLKSAIMDDHIAIESNTAKYAINLLENSDNQILKQQLSDPLFKIINPKEYNSLKSTILKNKNVEEYFKIEKELVKMISESLNSHEINNQTSSRIKTIFSLYKKINNKNLTLDQINDFLGIRIILDNVDNCYDTLKSLVREFKVNVNNTKDYISYPKSNGYKSIHLVIIHKNQPIEIQIRTKEMHEICEEGSASHLIYKKQFQLNLN